MRLIEFAYSALNGNPRVLTFDVQDISGIVQDEERQCKLITKQGGEYLLIGTHRALVNRWIYALEKKQAVYHDEIIRPSVLVYHQPDKIEVDNAFLDEDQLKAFCRALRPELEKKFNMMFP